MVIQQHLNGRNISVPRREAQSGGAVTSLRIDISSRVAVVAQKCFHSGYVWMRISRPACRLHQCGCSAIAALCTPRIDVGLLFEQKPNQLGATLPCGPEQSAVAVLPIDKLEIRVLSVGQITCEVQRETELQGPT